MRYIVDIETGPLPRAEIEPFLDDVKAPANYKSQESIDNYIEKKRLEMIDRAALSAFTGRVLAIGYCTEDGIPHVIHNDDETVILREFWELVNNGYMDELVGWNFDGFDMTFLMRRSWKHNVIVPQTAMNRCYWANTIDLMKVFAGGARENYCSLDKCARFLGIGEKNGSGADFADLLLVDSEAAFNYLKNDIKLTFRIAERLNQI